MNSTSTLRQNQNSTTDRLKPGLHYAEAGAGDRSRSRLQVGAPSPEGRRVSLQPALKAGTHVARCCGWVDLGTQPAYAGPGAGGGQDGQDSRISGFQRTEPPKGGTTLLGDRSRSRLQVGAPGKEPARMQRRVMITWLIRGEAGESWRVSREFAYGFGPRCGLRKLLEGWRGKGFANDAEARAVDPLRVLEQPGLVVVGFKEGSTWPRVEAVLPMLKGLVAEPLRWPPVFFTLAKPDRETFLKLPKWVQGKIRGSAEWGTMGGK